MGFFSDVSIINSYEVDREDLRNSIREQMRKIIREAYPDKSYYELLLMDDSSLNGLYGQAKKILKQSIEKTNIPEYLDFGSDETEDFERSGR